MDFLLRDKNTGLIIKQDHPNFKRDDERYFREEILLSVNRYVNYRLALIEDNKEINEKAS